jgi:hypothetical protein
MEDWSVEVAYFAGAPSATEAKMVRQGGNLLSEPGSPDYLTIQLFNYSTKY